MKKTFVLDTNVVLFDPEAVFKFEDNIVIVPITVIEEIDTFKKDASEIGRNARHFSRILDDLRKDNGGKSLVEGAPLGQHGQLFVALLNKDEDTVQKFFMQSNADIRILSIAYKTQQDSKAQKVILVTKDTNLRIRADVLGVEAQDYETQTVSIDTLYPGWKETEWTSHEIDNLIQERQVKTDEVYLPNELLLIKSKENQSQSVLGRYIEKDKHIKALSEFKRSVWGIKPRNLEQNFALDLLMDDDIQLVTLVGKAGTGKTLLALAASLYKVAEERKYHRVLVSRPVFPMGRDLGFLPGDIEEKLMPWMQPIFDNVDYIMSSSAGRDRKGSNQYKELMDMGYLSIEPLTYIRGRSISNQFMIVDEAQNLTPHEMKTIITRAGNNTKVILTGDPYQIDNPYLDASNNGLTYVVEKMKNEALAGHITLDQGERSDLAEMASNVL